MKDWLELALSAPVRKRAIRVALLVGLILVAINYADKAVAGTLEARDMFKIIMTFFVPYCVSTYSAVSALQEASRKATSL